jgi:hypothetical protein
MLQHDILSEWSVQFQPEFSTENIKHTSMIELYGIFGHPQCFYYSLYKKPFIWHYWAVIMKELREINSYGIPS